MNAIQSSPTKLATNIHANTYNLKMLDEEDAVAEPAYSNWFDRAQQAYDGKGNENFIDEDGELIEGIYLDLPNDVYHSLPALSSSKLKDFIKSPAMYYRNYVSDIDRKRTIAMTNTLNAGTHAHTLILEPQGYYRRYFRDLIQADMPDSLTTVAQIESVLVDLGEKKSGNKAEKAQRLFDKIEELKKDKDWQSSPVLNIKIFDIERQLYIESMGERSVIMDEGEEVVAWGGKIAVDSVVWDDAHRAMKTTRDHFEADQYFQFGAPEVAIIARCPITEMMLKVKYDWLRFDDIAVDMKTTRSTKPETFLRQLKDLHYDVQQEFYKYVAKLIGIPVDEFVFVATEFTEMDACQPFKLSPKMEKTAYMKVMSALPRLKECHKTNKWYGYSQQECTMILEG